MEVMQSPEIAFQQLIIIFITSFLSLAAFRKLPESFPKGNDGIPKKPGL